ncbi:MAG: T9SS type A sorting domain-containing protein [Bacteroidota bacterium]
MHRLALLIALLILSLIPTAHAQRVQPLDSEARGPYVAYALAASPTTPTYPAPAGLAFNPSGGVFVDRLGTGAYRMRFEGLDVLLASRSTVLNSEYGAGAHVQVTTHSTPGATCTVERWLPEAGALSVYVRCFDGTGAPRDAAFNALVLEPATYSGTLGYAWADKPSLASYVADGRYAFSSNGGTVTVRRTAPGAYTVAFPNLQDLVDPTIPGGGLHAQVTAYGVLPVRCQMTGWGRAAGAAQVDVRCLNPAGLAVDAPFNVLLVNRGLALNELGYTWADRPTISTYEPASGYSPSLRPSVQRASTGRYAVQFPGLDPTSGSVHVQVSTRQSALALCQTVRWGPRDTGLRAEVACYDGSGALTDAALAITVLVGQAPRPGDTDVTVSFEGFGPGTLLSNEFFTQYGILFPNGLLTVRCTEGRDDCTRARSARNVAIPLADTEFGRERIVINFAEPQAEVALSVNGAFLQNGERRVVTLTGHRYWNASGAFVTDEYEVESHAGWSTRLRVEAGPDDPPLYSVSLEAGLEGTGTLDNQVVIDDLYASSTSSQTEDTGPPRVTIDFLELADTGQGSYRLRVSDDLTLDQVTAEVVREDDSTRVWPPPGFSIVQCGDADSGGCGNRGFSARVGFTLPEAGRYTFVATGRDLVGNVTERRARIRYEPPPPPARVFVHKVELNQAVTNRLYDRNISLSDPTLLVPNKNLLLRYFLHAEGRDRPAFTAQLQVDITRTDGRVFTRRFGPNTTPDTVLVQPLPEDVGTARRDTLVQMRADSSRTLNFVVPGTWLNEARSMEVVLWEGVTELSRAQFDGLDENRSILALQLTLLNAMTPAAFDEEVRPYLEQALPYSEVRILSQRRDFFPGPPLVGTGLCGTYLIWQFLRGDDFGPTGLPTDGRYFATKGAIAPIDRSGLDCGGLAWRGWPNFISRAWGSTVAHEIGHTTGLKHASNFHGEGGGGSFVDWPYYHGAIGRPDETFGAILLPDEDRPARGDEGAWEVHIVDPCPTADLEERYPTCDLMDIEERHPTVPHEFMSYGISDGEDNPVPQLPGTRGRWTSTDTYNAMYGAVRPPDLSVMPMVAALEPDASVAPTHVANAQEPLTDALVVAALVKPEEGTASVLATMRRQARRAELTPSGGAAYTVQALDAAGAVLAEGATPGYEVTAHGRLETPQTMLPVFLPHQDGVAAFRILEQGVPLAEQPVSASAPTVQLLVPNGGEHLTEGTVTIRWTGGDADGDAVSYHVEYLTAPAGTWQSLGLVPPGQPTELTVTVADLAPSTTARFRVVASDGLRTSQDLSDADFSTDPSSPPDVFNNISLNSYDLYLYDTKTSRTSRVTTVPGRGEFNPAWSPTGQAVVHDVATFDVDGQTFVEQALAITRSHGTTLVPGSEGGNDAAWSPLLFFLAYDRLSEAGTRNVYAVPVWGGTPSLIRTDASDPAFSPLGRYLVVVQPSDQTLWSVDLLTGREALIGPGTQPSWSPNGRYLAFIQEGRLMALRVRKNGTPLGRRTPVALTEAGIAYSQPSWSPKSDEVYVAADRDGDVDLWVVSAEGGTPTRVTGQARAGDFDPAMSPWGRYVVYAGYTAPGDGAGKGTEAADANPLYMDAPARPWPSMADAVGEQFGWAQTDRSLQRQYADWLEHAPEAAYTPTALDLPGDFAVEAYPNPFNPVTTLRVQLAEAQPVQVIVYDLLGRMVTRLVDGPLEAGVHLIRWDAQGLPSGTYVYRVATPAGQHTGRVVLLK